MLNIGFTWDTNSFLLGESPLFVWPIYPPQLPPYADCCGLWLETYLWNVKEKPNLRLNTFHSNRKLRMTFFYVWERNFEETGLELWDHFPRWSVFAKTLNAVLLLCSWSWPLIIRLDDKILSDFIHSLSSITSSGLSFQERKTIYIYFFLNATILELAGLNSILLLSINKSCQCLVSWLDLTWQGQLCCQSRNKQHAFGRKSFPQRPPL